jgi:hypothetical protein
MPIVGTPVDLALSGWDDAPVEGPVFALGDVEADADVRFSATGNGRLVAPVGNGLWRRAPWPVRDWLFDLAEPPAEGGGALVVGAPEVAVGLRALGRTVEARERLDVEALRAAAVVVLADRHGALPAHAMCVLAARRILVADVDDEVTFGLQPGIEFFRGASVAEAVERANTALLHADVMAPLRVLGAHAAREHRASLVYPRLAGDLP